MFIKIIKKILFSIIFLSLTVPTHQSGRAYIKFIEYHDTTSCDNVVTSPDISGCDLYFNQLELYDSTRAQLVYVETTVSSHGSNTETVYFNDMFEVEAQYSFTLQTNDIVKLRVKVLHDGLEGASVRDISDVVIDFNTILASDTWTTQQITLGSPYGYLKIDIKISCDQYFGGLGCNMYCKPVEDTYTCNSEGKKICAEAHKTGENCDVCEVGWAGPQCLQCAENYYPSGACNVMCIPKEDKYTCNSEGKKICAEHKTGENCDVCEVGWAGPQCQQCAENYYPSDACNVMCIPVVGKYTCNSEGDKICAEHKTGENCDVCEVGWVGLQCLQCAENYYPSDACNVMCIPVVGKNSCSYQGVKVCNENWKGVDCDTCAERKTGENCDQCIIGWGGEKCQQCAENHYPTGVCNVRCTEVNNKFTCADDGGKVCSYNWKGTECDSCSAGYFGEDCAVFCAPTEHYYCSVTGSKVCIDITSNADNNCYEESPINVSVALAIGATVIAAISLALALALLKVVISSKRENEVNIMQSSEKP